MFSASSEKRFASVTLKSVAWYFSLPSGGNGGAGEANDPMPTEVRTRGGYFEALDIGVILSKRW